MTGLERIKEKILIQSQENCDKIIQNATMQAKSIIRQARDDANSKAFEIINKADDTANKKNAVSKSTAESITRNRYLEIRNAILNDVISAAYLEIEKFSDEKYFDMLKKLCIKNMLSGECTMHLNGYDLGRLPEDFELNLNKEIYENGAVMISEDAIDIENGFILRYGDVEVNCTLKSVFDESMDNLKDMLSNFMFQE